jgi:maltooligosyltrehalose trehalohydrolase
VHKFSVWAPNAQRVTLRVDGADAAMEHGHRGVWQAEVENAGHGSEYGFLLDDDPRVYPDSRSGWQPNGVHGLSRVYDAGRFPWTDGKWHPRPLRDAVMYELHVGTFTPEGTFDAVLGKLPYLKKLGVNYIELMPVNSFGGERGWGYDGVQLYAPHRAYGGPEGLQNLVNTCHQEGMAVLLDVVYNHLGPTGNYAPHFGPYVTQKYRNSWGVAMNLDEAGSHEVRNFLIDNALHWLRDYHLDGLRLDAVQTLVDISAHHFLEELSTEVHNLGAEMDRNFFLIAESDLNDPRLVVPVRQGGMGLDAQWIDDFHHALWSVLTGERHGYYRDFGSFSHIAKTLKSAYVYDGQFSEFRDRRHGRPIKPWLEKGLNGNKFIAYIHNHDQVGNRTVSERIRQVAGFNKAKIAAAVVILSPFVPLFFQGEEFATSHPFQFFTEYDDAKLVADMNEGRRKEHALPGMKWEDIPDPQDLKSFEVSKLPWQEIDQGEHAEMLDWYSRLVKLRGAREELRDGNLEKLEVRYSEEARWLVVQRQSTVLLCNVSDQERTIDLLGRWKVALESRTGFRLKNGHAYVPPESAIVLVEH